MRVSTSSYGDKVNFCAIHVLDIYFLGQSTIWLSEVFWRFLLNSKYRFFSIHSTAEIYGVGLHPATCLATSSIHSKFMADAREDRSAWAWRTQCLLAVHCLLLKSTVTHDSWLQFAHSCLQTTVDHSSPSSYQRNMRLPGAHNEKERTTLNTAHEPTFHQKST